MRKKRSAKAGARSLAEGGSILFDLELIDYLTHLHQCMIVRAYQEAANLLKAPDGNMAMTRALKRIRKGQVGEQKG